MNEYSVAIHKYISDKIAAAEKNVKLAERNSVAGSIRYDKGQLMELYNVRQYMVEKIDLKTQKYLRKKFHNFSHFRQLRHSSHFLDGYIYSV